MTECRNQIESEFPIEYNVFLFSNSPKEIEEGSNYNNDSNLNNLESKESNTVKYPKNVNSYNLLRNLQ